MVVEAECQNKVWLTIARKMGPDNHNISHSDQCQFSAGTENPEINGPRLGPPVAQPAHPVMK